MKNLGTHTLYGKFLILASILVMIMTMIVVIAFLTFNVFDKRNSLRDVESLLYDSFKLRYEFMQDFDDSIYASFMQNMRACDSASEGFDSEKMVEFKKIEHKYMKNFERTVHLTKDATSAEIKKYNNEASNLERLLSNEIKIMIHDKSEDALWMKSIITKVAAISVLSSLFVIIFLGRAITGPLVHLRQVALEIAAGNFGKRIDTEADDDLGELGRAFNQMLDKLQQSEEKIIEHQHDVSEKNKELAAANENLNESLDNILVLGEIGKYLISSMKFEDLYHLLYEHLRELIDVSTFSFGLYNPKKSTIDYKLIIENSEKKAQFSVDMNNNNRPDVIAVMNNIEIIINDTGVQNSEIAADFPMLKGIGPIEGLAPTTKSLVYLPITLEERVFAIICLENKKENWFMKHHRDFLHNIAAYISIAAHNANLYEKLDKK
ncbi:MAG: HAMP domain-containing protein [Candidatus Kapabacteria bacterium]|jgi:nitrate/nitrite-specific signal transduction histidine kinase|nr:HAMP domain-containing protein [Candidatus Kapabacteria bacterium]